MESKQSTLGIFLDLSCAFDTIDHNILLTKLYPSGIRGITHNWFSSYLTNCKQVTEHGTQLSQTIDTIYGVPQGSILGHIVFLIYVYDFSNCIKEANVVMYADDTNLFLSHKKMDWLFEDAQYKFFG